MSSKNIYIYLKETSDKTTSKDMSDSMDSNEWEQINKKYEVKMCDIVENLKVGKLGLHKYVDNVETESDKKIYGGYEWWKGLC